MYYHGKARTPVREVVLHCAAINTGQFDGMTAFQVYSTVNRWHRERGFKYGFGYHALIMPDGILYTGRPFDMIGAHVIGHNVGTLGFLLIEKRKIECPPGIEETGWLSQNTFRDYYTGQQRNTLRATLESLAHSHGVNKVSGHNDYAPRLCPGFKVQTKDWL